MDSFELAELKGHTDRIAFLSELKDLLTKYSARLALEEHSYGWDQHHSTITVELEWLRNGDDYFRYGKDAEFGNTIDIEDIDEQLKKYETVLKTQ